MMMTDLEMMMMIDGIDVVVGESKGDNYDEDVEDETAGLWMMRTMHNVLFGQYVFLPTEQAEAYLKMS